MTRIAIMQPYFAPYAGYFRLAAVSDVFVVYDCVQFPRRGWVHRNRLPDNEGRFQWLTLPLEKAPRDTAVAAMRFTKDASDTIEQASRRFPDLRKKECPLVAELDDLEGPLGCWLTRSLRTTFNLLGLDTPILRSSEMELSGNPRGQERILAIVERLGGSFYVNAPGGRELYDAAVFKQRGVELSFLPPYQGEAVSILHRLCNEDPTSVAEDIRRQSMAQAA